jgi:hypothetical protein
MTRIVGDCREEAAMQIVIGAVPTSEKVTPSMEGASKRGFQGGSAYRRIEDASNAASKDGDL